MKADKIILNEKRNVTLMAYTQEVEGEFGFRERPAMLVLPGGGYAMCSDREADAVALAYMQAGYQAFVLRYSVGVDKIWPQPLEDYEQAMEYIKGHAGEFHVEKNHIAVVGFSAGGHLAGCAATMAKNRPAAAVLVYPAVTKDVTDICAIRNLPETHTAVTKDTCPCFVVAAQDDHTVPVSNALRFELALSENGVPFESHIYSYGGHGFSTGEDWIVTNSVSGRVPHWVSDSIGWLDEIMGKLTRKGFTEPDMAAAMNSDYAPVLAVSCTLNHIRKQSNQVQEILKPLYSRLETIAKERGLQYEGLLKAIGGSSVRELMETCEMEKEEIIETDQKLHACVNILEV